MNTRVGLWIDHKKAIVVFLTGENEKIKLIRSFLEKPKQSSADDKQQREWTEDLNQYYDEVILSLHEAEAILIVGPGEAKGELRDCLERKPLAGREITVETVGRLTENQVVAKVRQHFLKRGAVASAR
jgi:stalled ribosome rescue protein Dom34